MPTAPLNLHLFEMRYRIMIRRIMESSRQFLYLPNFTDYQPHVVRSTPTQNTARTRTFY